MVSGFKDTIDSDDEKVLGTSRLNHVNEKFLDLSDPEPEPELKEDVGQVAQFSALDFDFLESLSIQPKPLDVGGVDDEDVSVGKKKKKSVKEKKVKKEKKKKRAKEVDESDEGVAAEAGQVVKKDADYEEL